MCSIIKVSITLNPAAILFRSTTFFSNCNMAAVAPGDQDWDYPAERVPAPLLNRKVSSCELDLLHQGNGANHAILRLVFKHPQTAASPHAPAGTTGLMINLEVNARVEAPGPIAGQLTVRTIRYTGANNRASFTIEIPIKGERRVNRFLKVLESANLTPCSFAYVHPDAVGCRDFM